MGRVDEWALCTLVAVTVYIKHNVICLYGPCMLYTYMDVQLCVVYNGDAMVVSYAHILTQPLLKFSNMGLYVGYESGWLGRGM